jgi:hypothetical protein
MSRLADAIAGTEVEKFPRIAYSNKFSKENIAIPIGNPTASFFVYVSNNLDFNATENPKNRGTIKKTNANNIKARPMMH